VTPHGWKVAIVAAADDASDQYPSSPVAPGSPTRAVFGPTLVRSLLPFFRGTGPFLTVRSLWRWGQGQLRGSTPEYITSVLAIALEKTSPAPRYSQRERFSIWIDAPLNRRRFLRLTAANILANLLAPLAGLCDLAFLGHLDEIRYLAGVALAGVLFSYIYWTFGFLRMGTTGPTAQAVGRGDRADMLAIGLRHLGLALAIGLAILLLQVPLRELGFSLLSATPAVKAAGRAYYNATIWGAPASLMGFVLLGWLLGCERGDRVLLLSAVQNGANVALNYLFVVRLGWASAGAGAATAASQYALLLVGLLAIAAERPWSVREASPQENRAVWAQVRARLGDRRALRALLALNTDILIRTFALISVLAAFTNLSAQLGTLVLAANALLMQVFTLAAYFIDGIAFATESFAGRYGGQGDRHLLRQLATWAGQLSWVTGLLFALAFNLAPQALLSLLTRHDAAIAIARGYAPWLLPVLTIGGLAFMLDGYFLGLAAGRVLRNATLLAAVLGFAPLAWLAWRGQSGHGLWLAFAVFMAGRATILGCVLLARLAAPVARSQR